MLGWKLTLDRQTGYSYSEKISETDQRIKQLAIIIFRFFMLFLCILCYVERMARLRVVGCGRKEVG